MLLCGASVIAVYRRFGAFITHDACSPRPAVSVAGPKSLKKKIDDQAIKYQTIGRLGQWRLGGGGGIRDVPSHSAGIMPHSTSVATGHVTPALICAGARGSEYCGGLPSRPQCATRSATAGSVDDKLGFVALVR